MTRGRPPYRAVLTPREQEVLSLVRQGLTNQQIADRLGISESGARYHVSEILSKLGVSSRHDAAAWRPEAAPRRSPIIAPFARLARRATASTAAKLVSGGAIAGTVAALLFLAAGLVLMDRRETPVPDVAAGVPSRAVEVVFAVDQVHDRDGRADPPSYVRAVDAGSGAVLAEIASGFTPWALFRRGAGQVIVVDYASQAEKAGRVRVIDLGTGTVVATFAAPDLPQPIVGAQGLAVLSTNEKWLYVVRVRWVPGCVGDALLCDRHSLGVIDLEDGVEAAALALPESCAPASLRADGADGVMGLCSGRLDLFRADPGGPVETLTAFGGRVADPAEGYTFKYPTPVDAGRAGDAAFYVVFETGEATVQRADGAVLWDGDILPRAGPVLRFQHRSAEGDQAILIAWNPADGSAIGAVVFDPAFPDRTSMVNVPGSARGVFLGDDGTSVALVDGDLTTFDRSTGQITATSVDLPGQSVFLQYGR